MKVKSRLDILCDIEDELNTKLPIHILPSDITLNDKWVAVEDVLDFLMEYNHDYSEMVYNDFLKEVLKK